MTGEELATAHDFSTLLDALLEGFQVIDFDFRYVLVNSAAARHGRKPASELRGRTMMECYPGIEQTEMFQHLRRCMLQRESLILTNEFAYDDGTSAHFELRVEPVPQGLCVLSIDVTARMQAEARLRLTEDRLRHSERMEAVGMLAAGIAHDFNNLLGIILGFGETALAREEGPRSDDVEGMLNAARSSAELTRQLLAYGRRQVMRKEVVDPIALVKNLELLLHRTIGPNVELLLQITPPVGSVEVDPSKLEQVVMNLVLNARDSIPGRGKITISLGEVTLDDAYVQHHPGSLAGPQVLLTVSDTGAGMDAATRARIFEPFYTTKAQGKGTGLGLATVYGVVKQSGGNIWVYSEPGLGTTFKVYLPRSAAAPRSIPPKSLVPKPSAAEAQQGTILVAEDDALLRTLSEHSLTAAGYVVRVAATGDEALRLAQTDASITLLITDVVMPGLRGPELIELARKARPDLKVLCTSGYALSALKEHESMPEEISFLEKPYLPSQLVRTVRRLLAS